MTKAKPSYKQLENEIALLKKQLQNHEGASQELTHNLKEVSFNSLFDIHEIQKLQDAFAEATGVASIITTPLGEPITKPSNYCHLCKNILTKTEEGSKNCHFTNAVFGKKDFKEAVSLHCLDGGLLDGGAGIYVGGTHIANWLIGQVVNEDFDPNKIIQNAIAIGADAEEVRAALNDVEKISPEKFKKIGDSLFLLANELSNKAYQNLQLKQNITEQENKEKLLLQAKIKAEEAATTLLNISDNIPAFIAIVDAKTLKYKFVNSQFIKGFNKIREELIGSHISEIIGQANTEFAMPYINQVRQGKSASYINSFNLAEGERYANVNYVPGFNKKGEVEDIIVLTHDITSIKKSELQLKKAKEKAREKEVYSKMLFGSSPVGLALNTLDGKFVDINKAFAAIIGYSISEALNLSYWDITPLKYSKSEAEQLKKLQENGIYGPYEKEYIHKSGKLVPVRLQGKIIEIDSEKFNLSSVENISERKNSEKLLKDQNKKLKLAKNLAQESEKRFKALHNASFGGIAIHNKGLILDCNQGLSDISGYPVDTLIGMNGLLLIAEKSRSEVMHNIATGYEKPYEAIGIRKDGSEYPVRLEARIIPYKGEIVRVVEFRDISIQKNIEQNLKEQAEKYEILNAKLQTINKKLTRAKEKAEASEEQLKRIANNFVDGMIYQVITLDEHARQFTYVSDAVRKLYGCTPEQAKQNPDLIYSKIHKEDIHQLIKKEQEALKNMSVFRTEARVVNPDGSIRWSIFISQPRIIAGQVCWDGFEIDITEHKKLEQDLIQAKEKAVESDKLKSAFLANMSHEIRTPMNSILGFSQLLKLPDLSAEDYEKYIDLINLGGNRLLTIISDIVDVSKIDANQLSIKIKPCNINELIDNIQQQFAISELSPDVNITTHKTLNSEACIIQTDSVRLTQILSNLMENALKFTKAGEVEFGYTANSKHLKFFVKDSGIGIDPKYHHLVFDRFRQVNENYHNTGTGTGLGLSIVKGLVELLGGKIWIESEIDKGATFYFTLPFKKAIS